MFDRSVGNAKRLCREDQWDESEREKIREKLGNGDVDDVLLYETLICVQMPRGELIDSGAPLLLRVGWPRDRRTMSMWLPTRNERCLHIQYYDKMLEREADEKI